MMEKITQSTKAMTTITKEIMDKGFTLEGDDSEINEKKAVKIAETE